MHSCSYFTVGLKSLTYRVENHSFGSLVTIPFVSSTYQFIFYQALRNRIVKSVHPCAIDQYYKYDDKYNLDNNDPGVGTE